MDPTIHTMYILFLQWDFPLITYNGDVYFTDKKITNYLVIDRFANQDFNDFLNKYGIVDKQRERECYKRAKTLQVNGERVEVIPKCME